MHWTPTPRGTFPEDGKWMAPSRSSAAWSKCAKSRQNAMWGRITLHSTEILHKIVQILVLQMMKGARTAEISFHTKRRKGLKYHSDVFTTDKICNDFNNRHTFNYEQFSIINTWMSHLWIFHLIYWVVEGIDADRQPLGLAPAS